jgi:hypothetical protein
MEKIKKYPLNPAHLKHTDRKRYKEFKKDRKKIQSCVGNNTINLLGQFDDLGKVRFALPSFDSRKGNYNDSGYLLSIGCLSHPLKYGYNTIGRSPTNDILIDDQYASRAHCSLLVHSDGNIEIFDTASANGTFLDGKRVKQAWLKSGDTLTIGTTNISIILDCQGYIN